MKNPFRRKPVLPTNLNSMEVLMIEEGEREMWVAFGIHKERSMELLNEIDEANKKTGYPPELIAAVSKICKHPNELAYASYVLGTFVKYFDDRGWELATN